MSVKIMIVSDGTGDTASSISRAAITQFKDQDVLFTRYRNIKDKNELASIVQEASIHHDVIMYTLVTPEVREEMESLCEMKNVSTIDIMGPIISSLSIALSQQPEFKAGVLHTMNSDYYDRMDALEFTMKSDENIKDKDIVEADIILLGVSRTSKTPLAIYLSLSGLKVVNITLKKETPLPEKIWQIDQRKIYVLTIDQEKLIEFRKKKCHKTGDNFDALKIVDEYKWSLDLYKKNIRWPVFNVSEKTLKETSSDIQKLYKTREASREKQNKRYD